MLFSVALGNLVGCSSMPAPPSAETRKHLGHIGVYAVSSTPIVEFRTFAKGWAAGAVKGGSIGMVNGLVGALGEAVKNPPSGPYAAPAMLITTTILTTVNTLAHSIAGGMEAVPAKTSRQIDQELISVLGDVVLADDLAKSISKASFSRADLKDYTVKYLDTYQSNAVPTNRALPQQDTVVEVRITEVGFRGGSGPNPNVNFYLNARIRLINVNTGSESYTRDFQYLSRARPFAEWFSNGATVLLSGFGQAMETLADRIVDELFIVTGFPFGSGLWALPGQPEFGSCWIRPMQPELKYASLWHQIQKHSPGIEIRYTEVESLQPLFQWETFPRPRDLTPANEVVLNKISDVTYDFKIWNATGDYPERLVYDVSNLKDAQHRISITLTPKTKYYWSVRARYKLADRVQVTRWAFSNIPSNTPSDYPQRHPGGSCDLDAIPSTNYFRFITP